MSLAKRQRHAAVPVYTISAGSHRCPRSPRAGCPGPATRCNVRFAGAVGWASQGWLRGSAAPFAQNCLQTAKYVKQHKRASSGAPIPQNSVLRGRFLRPGGGVSRKGAARLCVSTLLCEVHGTTAATVTARRRQLTTSSNGSMAPTRADSTAERAVPLQVSAACSTAWRQDLSKWTISGAACRAAFANHRSDGSQRVPCRQSLSSNACPLIPLNKLTVAVEHVALAFSPGAKRLGTTQRNATTSWRGRQQWTTHACPAPKRPRPARTTNLGRRCCTRIRASAGRLQNHAHTAPPRAPVPAPQISS